MKTQQIRVAIVNFQTLGAQCGYGVGRTHDEAVDDAMERALRDDPQAYYDPQTDSVRFAGGIHC